MNQPNRHQVVPGYYSINYEECKVGQNPARDKCTIKGKPEAAEKEAAAPEEAEGAQGAFKTLIDDVYAPTEELLQDPSVQQDLQQIEPETVEQLEANFNEIINQATEGMQPQIDSAIDAARGGDTSQLEGLFSVGNLEAIAGSMQGIDISDSISLSDASKDALLSGIESIGNKVLSGVNAGMQKFKELVKDWGSEFWEAVTDPVSIGNILKVAVVGLAIGAMTAVLGGAAGSLAIPAIAGLGAAAIPAAVIAMPAFGRMISQKIECALGGEACEKEFAIA